VKKPYVLIWGGGDLASGIAMRLNRVGIRALVVEMDQPRMVRRSVSFAQAVYDGDTRVEDIPGKLVTSPVEAEKCWEKGIMPVIVDPQLTLIKAFPPLALVDARMRKKQVPLSLDLADLLIGLGPGFIAGKNCHAAIETNRGHFLGRALWEGASEAHTGIPGTVLGYDRERVLYAPADGKLKAFKNIGDSVKKGEPILSVNGVNVLAPFDGVLRGLIHESVRLRRGMKIGDVDPRPEPFRCWTVSEKALAVGGGVLEALLTGDLIRSRLWQD
jgi:xanthine dehydrogenase accessory factor